MAEFKKRTTAPVKGDKYYYLNNIFYNCGYGMPNCFSGETKIITRNGIKTMLECLGKEIEVLDLNGEWKKATVKDFGENTLYELEFSDGYKVLTTPEHRWLVNKKSSHKDKNYNVLKEYETKDLKVSRNYNFPINKISNEQNIEYDINGVVHGFVFGDGSLYNKEKYSRASVCGDKKEFMPFIFDNLTEKPHKCQCKNGTIEYYPFPKEYKGLPELEKDEKYLLGFIIGIIASDGTVSSTVEITNKNRETLEYIKEICSILKIKTGEVRESTVKIKKCLNRTYENYALYRLTINKSSISPEMLINPKHKEKFNSIKKKNINYCHLKSIKKTNMYSKVYCVVEPTTHTFTLENMIITKNCTAYAWGRFYEISNQRPKLCTANAENWYKYNDGYKRGKTPKLGAVIVWSKGVIGNAKDGAGHVAIVEEIYDDGSFLTSNSAYKSTNFYTKKINAKCELSGYKFEGFIYNPVEFETKKGYSGKFPTLPSKGCLQKGDKGTQVGYLQQFLNWYGNYGLEVDKSFGSITEGAVKKFQKSSGKLEVDGKYGAKSLAYSKTVKK